MVKQCANPKCEKLFEATRNHQYCSEECQKIVATEKLLKRPSEKPNEILRWKLAFIKDNLDKSAEFISAKIGRPISVIMKVCEAQGWKKPEITSPRRRNEQRKVLLPDPPKAPIQRVKGEYSNNREFPYHIARL